MKKYSNLIYLGIGANPSLKTFAEIAESVWLFDASSKVIDTIKNALEDNAFDNVSVVQGLVLPEEQDAVFYEYNLSWLSGPYPADENTQQLYPGLLCESQVSQKSRSIDSLIEACLKHQSQDEPKQDNILIIDLGSQAQELMDRLAGSLILQKLHSIVINSGRTSQSFDFPYLSSVANNELFYKPTEGSQAYVLNSEWLTKVQIEEGEKVLLAQTLKDLKAQKTLLEKEGERSNALQEQLNTQSQNLDDAKTLAEALQVQLDEKNVALNEEKSFTATLQNQLNSKETALQEVQSLSDDLKLQLEDVSKQRDQEAHWHQENKKWAEQLKTKVETLEKQLVETEQNTQQEKQELIANKEELQQALIEQTEKNSALQNEIEKQKQGYDELNQARSDLENTKSKLKTTLQERTEQRDQEAHWHQENKKWAEQLKTQVETLEKQLVETEQNTQQEKQEHIANKEELQQALLEQTEKNSTLQNEIEKQKQGYDELKQAYSDLENAKSELEAALQERTEQRDQEAHWQQENKKWAESLKVKVSALEQELKAKNQTENVLQKLLLKANSDLENLRVKYSHIKKSKAKNG